MRKMMNILFLVTLCDQTLGYATCPGDLGSYVATGLPEQWPCHGACISVDEACDGECYDYQDTVFLLNNNNNKTCTRDTQWYTCDSSTGSTVGEWPCAPGSPGCQPLHVPCGGKCPGGGYYEAFWKCPNEQRCILSALICSGLGPFCSDGSDQSNNTCFMTGITGCPRVNSEQPVSRSQHCKGAGRYQCVKPVKGINCLDVSDQHKNTEEIASGNNTDKSDLVKKLPTCTTIDGYEGLECLNNECIEMSVWCSPTHWQGKVCKLQADPLVEVSDVRHAGSVCTDKEFWEGRPCDNEDWQRCSGTHPGQCYVKTTQCVTTTGAWGVGCGFIC